MFRVYIFILALLLVSCQHKKGDYVCPPCDLKCDNLSFEKPGSCPHCSMELVLKSELEADSNLIVNDVKIEEGSGKFLMEGGYDTIKTIWVHYHQPKNFTKNSKVIFVLPGAGRNGKDYRDTWVDASEKYNLLVLSLEYPEAHYPGFWSYNLGGMISDVNIENETYTINQNTDQWLFEDFDRIFDAVKTEADLIADRYDMFGHSAGGQILHRLAIFNPNTKADRILASNSGWYTIPTLLGSFPYGLENMHDVTSDLDFSSKLVLFLGEKDDANETRGHLRRSSEVDKQGLHRLERGIYFYNESKRIANESNLEFNWKIEIVSNVGHDYKEMSKRASEFLYGSDRD